MNRLLGNRRLRDVRIESVKECSKFQLRVNLPQAHLVRLPLLAPGGIKRDGHIRPDGRQELRETNLLRVLLHLLLLRPFQLIGIRQQVLHTTELGEELLGGLLAHARATGNIVGRIAHQSQQVNHLVGRAKVVFLQYLGHTQHFVATPVFGAIHIYMVGHQLTVVLIGCHHIDLEALCGGLPGDGPDHVVRLEAGHFQDGDTISVDNVANHGDGEADYLGRLLALCLVLLERLMAERRSLGVETDRHMRRLLAPQHILQYIDKAEHGRGIEPFRVDTRALNQRVIRSIDKRVSVD